MCVNTQLCSWLPTPHEWPGRAGQWAPSPAQWVQSAKMSSHWEVPKWILPVPSPHPHPLPSAKSGRPPPTLAKFSSSGPPTGLGGVKTLECEQLKSTGFFVKHPTNELEIAPVPL
eukprot:scaffold5373_cov103-Isochrysis_galbana.AAC.5